MVEAGVEPVRTSDEPFRTGPAGLGAVVVLLSVALLPRGSSTVLVVELLFVLMVDPTVAGGSVVAQVLSSAERKEEEAKVWLSSTLVGFARFLGQIQPLQLVPGLLGSTSTCPWGQMHW